MRSVCFMRSVLYNANENGAVGPAHVIAEWACIKNTTSSRIRVNELLGKQKN